jgi:hypothetical protein
MRHHHNQPDLFGAPTPPILTPDPADVRRTMQKVLDQLRSAETMPFEPRLVRIWKTIFPQMSNWLEPEEAHELCRQFDAEIARLETGGASV